MHPLIATSIGHRVRSVLAAGILACASFAAPAALVSFSGAADSGPLAGESFNGRLAYADPLADFTGSVALDHFELSFLGQWYALADADAPAVAWFDAGTFLGVDVQFSAALPALQLVAGFFDVADAHFAYDRSGQGVEGFGSIRFVTEQAVPEPGAAALALAGLALLGAGRARSRRPGARA